MKYQLTDFNRNVPDEELLADMKKVAENLGVSKLSSRAYDNNGGKYTAGTIGVRFGSWNSALEKAGLNLVHHRDVAEKELFKNLETVWINIGRQPTFRDMKNPLSKYSTHQYVTKFGNWRKALEAFVEYINSANDERDDEEIVKEIIPKNEKVFKHTTRRNPSARLKVQVLMRDGNKCSLCGITVIGKDIHFDHKKPWSLGGETVLENLQILCAEHNLAKSNLEYPVK
jgi:hypothetical protein